MIEQSSARPILMMRLIASRLGTGSAPGSPRQTGHTLVLGAASKRAGHPQNIFDSVDNSTWVSRPITASQLTGHLL